MHKRNKYFQVYGTNSRAANISYNLTEFYIIFEAFRMKYRIIEV